MKTKQNKTKQFNIMSFVFPDGHDVFLSMLQGRIASIWSHFSSQPAYQSLTF